MPQINVNGVDIFYIDQGIGEETIVFSHGLLWSHKMFKDQVEFLQTRFRVIAYDHRGQGQSEVSGPFDMDTITEDAAELISALCDKPVHFAGLSMGGFVGMRLAARHPKLIKSLILMETSANAEPVSNLPRYKTLNGFVKWFGLLNPVANKVMKIMFAESWLTDPMNSDKIDYWKSEIKANKKSITGPVEGVIYRKGIENELS
ncbi:MAG: alpha/beta hydrolase, partial [Algoriphagus sp.]